VLAAHPDDETIGASVLLARSHDPVVIYLTDGAPRDAKLWSTDFHGSRDEYAFMRRAEAMRALSCAGVTEEQTQWLGAPDQDAIFHSSELVGKLAEVMTRVEVDLVVTHPYEGGHPDHDAAALVARQAVAQFGENAPILLEMTSYHARQTRCVTGEFLQPKAADEICFQLTEEDRQRKRKMFESYASQRPVLSAFDATQERWRKGPNCDFSRPPHEGKLWYECMDWPTTGEKWRAVAAASMAELREHSCR